MQIWPLTTLFAGAKQVKAMREDSGDRRGVREMERRVVRVC